MAGPQPITLTEMDAYCRMFGVRDNERLVRLVRAADRGYLARAYERSKQTQNQQPTQKRKAR